MTGLGRELSAALRWWRRPRAEHGPGKVVLDLALAIAARGDTGSGVQALLHHVSDLKLEYSVGIHARQRCWAPWPRCPAAPGGKRSTSTATQQDGASVAKITCYLPNAHIGSRPACGS